MHLAAVIAVNITVYISGHGFGHLAQMAPVMKHLREQQPDCRFLVRCALDRHEIGARLGFDVELEQSPVDVGVVQKNAIEEDREASIIGIRTWLDSVDDQIKREIDLLASFRTDLVISDISPLAFPAARALGVPGVGLATLDWFTIYAHWLAADDAVLEKLTHAYSQCDLLLTPPMAMDMPVFPVRRQIPLIAAYPSGKTCPPEKKRSKTALVIFGGSNQPAFDVQALAAMDDWQFLMPLAPTDAPDNVTSVSFGRDLKAVDLMPFVDVVVCKPGYGILAECWATATPIAWVERPDFPEYPMLKGWLQNGFPSCGMNRSDFSRSLWLPALEGALACRRQFPQISADGAQVAATEILACLNG